MLKRQGVSELIDYWAMNGAPEKNDFSRKDTRKRDCVSAPVVVPPISLPLSNVTHCRSRSLAGSHLRRLLSLFSPINGDFSSAPSEGRGKMFISSTRIKVRVFRRSRRDEQHNLLPSEANADSDVRYL